MPHEQLSAEPALDKIVMPVSGLSSACLASQVSTVLPPTPPPQELHFYSFSTSGTEHPFCSFNPHVGSKACPPGPRSTEPRAIVAKPRDAAESVRMSTDAVRSPNQLCTLLI